MCVNHTAMDQPPQQSACAGAAGCELMVSLEPISNLIDDQMITSLAIWLHHRMRMQAKPALTKRGLETRKQLLLLLLQQPKGSAAVRCMRRLLT